MMAYGQLRFWAADKLAYESEAWPQALFVFVFDTLFSKNDPKSMFWSKIGRKSTYIVENRSKSLVTDRYYGKVRTVGAVGSGRSVTIYQRFSTNFDEFGRFSTDF